MSPIAEIANVDVKINQVRLDIIRIIAEINAMLASVPRALRTDGYRDAKERYTLKQEELHCLRTIRKELNTLLR